MEMMFEFFRESANLLYFGSSFGSTFNINASPFEKLLLTGTSIYFPSCKRKVESRRESFASYLKSFGDLSKL